MQSGKRILVAAALPLLALHGAARADVLEINASGHQWIAGGPQLAGSGTAGPAEAAAPFEPELQPQALTGVAETAGPDRWRARIAELAVKYDISPALLDAVVWQESRWKERAVSPAGARGLTQLMPGTARMMGVDPDDPNANLEGGARYLRLQLDAFSGDLERALAAYNAGPGRVMKAGGVPRIRETQAYIASVMSRLAEPVRE